MLRLIFAGTPVFAQRALQALHDAGHDVALVLTQPDKPAGRGQQLQASPVKQLAERLGLEVFQPRTLRDPQACGKLREAKADAMVVAAYGLILPAEVLAIPRFGCLNIHASLLPRWRGAAPIQRAIEAGDAVTGITIMQMDEGLDTGAMLLAEPAPIGPEDTGGVVHDRLAELGARLIVEALARLEAGGLPATPQPAEGVTYAHKLGKADARLDFDRPAGELADRIRAFDPFPGAAAVLERAPGSPIKFWKAKAVDIRHDAAPGTVLIAEPGRMLVACREGALDALELQKPGGRRLPVADFLRGFPLQPGDRFVPGG